MSNSTQTLQNAPQGAAKSAPLDQFDEKDPAMDMSQKFEVSPIHQATPLHDAELLTNGNGLAHIKLGDQLYVLRITRAGKLILTK